MIYLNNVNDRTLLGILKYDIEKFDKWLGITADEKCGNPAHTVNYITLEEDFSEQEGLYLNKI